jgi:cytochrome c oxidase subunit II
MRFGARLQPWYGVTWLLFAVGFLHGCAGHQQSVIDPAGPQAGRIGVLWWFFFWLLGFIFLVVMIVMLLTLMRRHRGIAQEPMETTHKPSEATDSRLRRVVTASGVATVVILFVLIIASVSTGKGISELSNKRNPLTIEVTGNQWWWQIRYVSDQPQQSLVTANEIHIPINRPIQIRGMSNDVIHSFWVPNLHGKRDLIPSRVTVEWIEADHPGRFRGQCAEFCGLQHAHMAFWVVAEPEAQFDDWMKQQLQPAVTPADPVLQRGQQVFLNNACVFCHGIRGTTAAGQNAPDLTHFGSRTGIAANTLPNTKGNLAGWILDPQSVKPGNHMATIALNSTDVQPLIEYLESLK